MPIHIERELLLMAPMQISTNATSIESLATLLFFRRVLFWMVMENGRILAESRRARMDTRDLQQPQPLFSENTFLNIERKRLDLFDANSFREAR